MWSAAIQWLHLFGVVVFILSLRIAQVIITSVYAILPLPSAFDSMLKRFRPLRRYFSGRLAGLGAHHTRGVRTTKIMVEAAGYGLQEHCIRTEDGFLLGVHRILPRQHPLAPPPGGHRRVDDSDDSDASPLATPSATLDPASPPLQSAISESLVLPSPQPRSDMQANATAEVEYVSAGCIPAPLDTPTKLAAAAELDHVRKTHRPVALLMHGLLQCDEAWLVDGGAGVLPYLLVDAGFDVWLGNNRGNKYSGKHMKLTRNDDEFWNFSLDDFARKDVPAMVDYILRLTGADGLHYVGFSQGSAQGLAAFACQPFLAQRIKTAVCLAPPTSVKHMPNSVLTSLVRANLAFLNLVFGRKDVLSMCLAWQRILSPYLFVKLVDMSMMYLFRWHTRNMDPERKLQMYQHIFSPSSVKSVTHWMQIMHSCRFQAFDDAPPPSIFSSLLASLLSMLFPSVAPQLGTGMGDNRNPSLSRYWVSPEYDLSLIPHRVVLFYGDADTIINMHALQRRLQLGVVYRVPGYEHLDMIWGKDAGELVFTRLQQELVFSEQMWRERSKPHRRPQRPARLVQEGEEGKEPERD